MTAELDLDRRLERWFADEAPAHAPDRVLTGAIEVVDRTPQRRGLTVRAGRQWAGMTRSRRVAFAVVALLLALVAAAAIGALVDRIAPGDHPPSLVIVRSDDGTDQAQAITVIERAADGTEQTLAHFTADQLGGAVQLWLGSAVISDFDHLALPIGRADGTYGYAIADVRDPTTPIQQLDITGSYGAFGPDGDLGISLPEGLGVHDPFTGTSTTTGLVPVDGNPPYPPTALDQFLSWAADGSGVLADEGMFLGQDDGTTKASAIGILRRDGEFVTGTVPLRYDGVRARRTDPNGVLLRCAGGYDSCYDAVEWSIYAVTNDEMHVVWDNPGTDRRISDFAWAADGGLWLLLETAAPGPRHVSLVRVAPDGVETTISEFDAPADDPDEGSYFQSSTFAAMAPDDSHLAIRISGDQGSPGATWLIDPATGERQEISGSIAGWRQPGGADRTRPDATMVTPMDPLIRDLWADAETSVRFGATSVVVDAVGEAVKGVAAGGGAESGGREVVVSGEMSAYGCSADQSGRYSWAIEAGRLTLTAIDDPCAGRQALLARTFDRSLPTNQDGPPHVPAGATYRAAAFTRPFMVTIPTGPSDEVELWAHRPTLVGLMATDPTGAASPGVVIVAPTKGAADVCEHRGEAAALAPGTAGILAYLEAHDLPLLDEATTEVDGHAATTFRLEAPAGCSTDNHSGLTLFSGGDESPTSVGDGARLIVFELQDGTPIVIIDQSDPTDPVATAWAEELVSSIRFDQP